MNECCLQNSNSYKASEKYDLFIKLEIFPRMLEYWYQRSWQRKQLAKLDDHMLKDIGYSRQQAEIEAVKPFWK